jgi:TATA-box binding protein (TBP) (component of TFIID and TFIIIB)
MFARGIWMLMTRIDDINEIYDIVESYFGKRPVSVEVTNITMIYRLHRNIDLDTLFDSLTSCEQGQLYLHAPRGQQVVLMDRQKYPALMITPFQDKSCVLEVYANGPINATGMKSDDDVRSIREFIESKIGACV